LLFNYFKSPKSKLRKLFLDWSPEFKPYLASIGEIKTLECLIVRGCQLEDSNFIQMMNSIKSGGLRIRLLDMYSNQLTDESIAFLSNYVQDYKYVESYGFGLNKIKKLSSFMGLFDKVGSTDTTKAEFDSYQVAFKNREAVVAKNLKLKAAKKPEEPLPYIEEVTAEEGGKFVKKQYPNLQYLNLVGNPIENESDYGYIEALLRRAPNLHIILSGTKINIETLAKLHDVFQARFYYK